MAPSYIILYITQFTALLFYTKRLSISLHENKCNDANVEGYTIAIGSKTNF